MDIYQFIGFAAGILIIINTAPQLIKTVRTKNVENLSLGMFFLIISAQLLWLIYGIHLKDLPLISTNSLGMVFVGTNIGLIFKYRTNRGG